MAILVLCGALVFGDLPAAVAGGCHGKLPPPKVQKMNTACRAFRAEFEGAVRRRDAAFILGIVDPQISVSFGPEEGISGFKKRWNLSRRSDPFWKEIEELLQLGGKCDGESYLFPYVFTEWPSASDEYECGAILKDRVAVRREPREGSAVLATLAYDIVKLGGEMSDAECAPGAPAACRERWQKILLEDGRAGYVNKKDIRSPIDFRAEFKRIRGRWRMTFFIAGD